MTNEEFIQKNREADVRTLALKPMPDGVDSVWCLRQIEGYQLAKKKLPRWASAEGMWFPPRISMEQCSSESTATYKAKVAESLSCKDSFLDMTGGFGVDFSYMAPLFKKATYVERQDILCETARHNFPLLGLGNVEIVNALSGGDFSLSTNHYSLIFLDPARRDDIGRKVFAIEDCTPDITLLQDELLNNADYVMVKLSPMLDITMALRTLHGVSEVHVVSVQGECKELLFIMNRNADTASTRIHCVNLDTADKDFTCILKDIATTHVDFSMPEVGDCLFEPNASIMKAGVQDTFALHYGLKKLHQHSNLFIKNICETDTGVVTSVPSRIFRITNILDFSKQSLKLLQRTVGQANIAIRNFPSTVAELRKRLKLKDGGNVYIFATTLCDGSHVLLLCEKY